MSTSARLPGLSDPARSSIPKERAPSIVPSSNTRYMEPSKVIAERQLRVEQPTLDYIARRIREGALRKMEPRHAVLAFGAMLLGYIVRQQIIGMSSHKKYNRRKITQDFVTIFLEGMHK